MPNMDFLTDKIIFKETIEIDSNGTKQKHKIQNQSYHFKTVIIGWCPIQNKSDGREDYAKLRFLPKAPSPEASSQAVSASFLVRI